MSSATLPDMQGVPPRLGRYKLHYRIASGGMASVWLARATGANAFEKVVAIKTIHGHMVGESAAVRMFIDEARIASSIDHPNVCHVFDFGEESGTHYLVMEYLVGESLARLRQRLATLETGELRQHLPAFAARIIADAAEGLHAAHELTDEHGRSRQVVHRDVSPQNIFVTYEGTVKVVDFGIAKAQAKLEKTQPGIFKGKIAYAAPEQIRDLPIDRRADLWALGVCLWELLTLRRLFKRDDPAATLSAIALDPIPPPSSVMPGLSPTLDAIVMKALERDVGARYQTARELGRALRAYLAERGEVVDAPEVGEWMSQLFPEDKAKRYAAREAVLERGDGSGDPGSLPAGLAIKPTPTRDDTRAPAAAPSRVRAVVAFSLALAALLAGGAVIAQRRTSDLPPVVDETSDAALADAPETVVEVIELADLVDAGEVAVQAEPLDGSTVMAMAVDASVGPALAEVTSVDASVTTPLLLEAPTTVDAGALLARNVKPPPTRKPLPRKDSPEQPPTAVVPPVAPPPVAPSAAPPLIGDPKLGTGRLRVLGGKGQYEVRIDGQLVGKTPLIVDLSVGTHRLDFREQGAPSGPSKELRVGLAAEYVIELN